MKPLIIPVLAVAGLMNTATAYAFDPKQCACISDVDVPYEVSATDAAIQFRGAGVDITVTPTAISSGERRYSGNLAGGYYKSVRQFLATANTMSRTANPFGSAGGISAMGSAATNMCQAILDMGAANVAIEQAFEDFSSPVRIVLR